MAKKKLDKKAIGNVAGGIIRMRPNGNYGVFSDHDDKLLYESESLTEAQSWAKQHSLDDTLDPINYTFMTEKITDAPGGKSEPFSSYGFDNR